MRLNPLAVTVVSATLLATVGCSRQPEQGTPAANADAVADQLEAKANNYSMMADNTADTEAALALENASGSLGEQSANVRAEAHPNNKTK